MEKPDQLLESEIIQVNGEKKTTRSTERKTT